MAALCFTCNASPFSEIALVLVRLDHVASRIVNNDWLPDYDVDLPHRVSPDGYEKIT
jgi:hypothetical protein